MLEVEESRKIRGDVPAGKEVSACVGFARILLEESEEGGGLIFAIAGEFWAMFSVVFFVFDNALSTAASWVRTVIMIGV